MEIDVNDLKQEIWKDKTPKEKIKIAKIKQQGKEIFQDLL